MEALANIIGSAFPFHLVLDSDLKVVDSGNRLPELVPGLAPGRELNAFLRIERPLRTRDFDQIRRSVGELFILSVIEGDLRLRGQFFPYDHGAEQQVLFLGHPWIIDLGSMQAQGLRLADFPPHAGIADMLVLLQTQRSGLVESQGLAEKLRHASDELKARNLQLIEEIERRAQTEENMLQSQKMEAIGQLAGGVAHDLNNILLAINGHVSMAMRQVSTPEKVLENLEHVLAASKRATELTARLLSFGRRQVLSDVAVDIAHAFSEVEHILRPLLGERVELDFNASGEPGAVLIDPSALQQVLLNLAINARDAFGAQGGSIRITGQPFEVLKPRTCLLGELNRGHWVRIQVIDDGAGIDPEILERIFEPFFTTKPQGQGTGLGLSTVWWIIERSGGAMDVESSGAGGTTFSIYLRPTESPDPEKAPEDQGDQLQKTSGRILLVEDEDMVRQPVSSMLELLGWTVTEFSNAEDALVFIEGLDDSIDMVLTDLVMPGLSGREFAEMLREQWPDLPIIFMTGYDPDSAGGFLNADELVITKPFDLEELEAFLVKADPSR